MNAHFERSGTYPFTTQPAKGYDAKDPTPDAVIINIKTGKFVLVVNDHHFEYVDNREEASVFSNAVDAVRAAAKLTQQDRIAA